MQSAALGGAYKGASEFIFLEKWNVSDIHLQTCMYMLTQARGQVSVQLPSGTLP